MTIGQEKTVKFHFCIDYDGWILGPIFVIHLVCFSLKKRKVLDILWPNNKTSEPSSSFTNQKVIPYLLVVHGCRNTIEYLIMLQILLLKSTNSKNPL